MNTVFNLSSDTDRTFAISILEGYANDIAGSPHQAMLRSSNYTVKVAYSGLSKTLQSITKRGGKVLNVRMLSAPLPSVANIPVAAVVPPEIEPSPPVPKDLAVSKSPSTSRRPPAKSKKR
ncbi:phycobilisome linker polypeptide [Chamaesiphon sp. OTE_8_metabat_110]|uniref:phycobilisome linker polypeptide n=1 Tax=Chamaesiphon sp. OTE_8_metabat_110 TaxID=2964696 RepID=UPI00286BC5D2|nr:phycobilisome linker polypeptide [Chamaesiphon sp. OTE_8_metabat_110]